jgi:hypothetical protein
MNRCDTGSHILYLIQIHLDRVEQIVDSGFFGVVYVTFEEFFQVHNDFTQARRVCSFNYYTYSPLEQLVSAPGSIEKRIHMLKSAPIDVRMTACFLHRVLTSHVRGQRGTMRYLKIILTVIAFLLALNLLKPILIPEALSSGTVNVNVERIGGASQLGRIIQVEIVQ